jgi:sulfocyanin
MPASADAPAWMQVDAAHESVHFDIKMAENGDNGTLNFNGYAKGALTITVPAGWHVTMHVVNAGAGAIPHSLEILPVSEAIPSQGVEPPAFSGAETIDLIPGLNPGQGDDVDFIADAPGKYWIFCGVPGHGVSGMWDYLVVSASAAAPSVAETKP